MRAERSAGGRAARREGGTAVTASAVARIDASGASASQCVSAQYKN